MLDAASYLDSLKIIRRRPSKPAIGRLTVSAEFELDGRHGVVVRPKRGEVSSRYLEMLAATGVDFVVVDGAAPLSIHGRLGTGQLAPIRALPVEHPTAFPAPAVLGLLVDLLLDANRGHGDALGLGSQLLASKLADEESGSKLYTPAVVAVRDGPKAIELIETVTGAALRSGDADEGTVSTIIAVLAGYRILPQSESDAALLIGLFARLADPKGWGLPVELAFAVTGAWTAGARTLVASAIPGIQLLPLRAAKAGQAFLPLPNASENPLLRHIFPNTLFADVDFLSWSPGGLEDAPDRLFVVPPLGGWITAVDVLQRFALSQRPGGKLASRAPAETLYIEHAVEVAGVGALIVAVLPEGLLSSVGHAEFRKWLLERTQLLAVMSLPPGSCFAGTGVRCSVVYLRKVHPVPSDYPIAMVEVETVDVANAEAQGRLSAVIAEAVAGEVHP